MDTKDPQEVTLRFPLTRLEYIGNVLAQRPYAEVAAIIADIQAQIAAQATPPADSKAQLRPVS